MNIIRIYLIAILTFCFSCKSNDDRSTTDPENSRQNADLVNQMFVFHEKMIRVTENGQDERSFELASKTLDGPQLNIEYNFTSDQIYLSRNHLYELILNEADIVFLANDLSLKSKITFQPYQGCHQFLLIFDSNDSNHRADLILVPGQRELVFTDEDHYGVLCIEDNILSFDFRSEIKTELASEILKKSIFLAERDSLSLTAWKFGFGKKAGGATDLKLPSQYSPMLPKKLLNKKIPKKDQDTADLLVDEVRASDDLFKIQDDIESMTYPQTVHFLRKFITDKDLRAHKHSSEIRQSIEENLIDKIESSPRSLLPDESATPTIGVGGAMTPSNIKRYMDYLGSVHGVKTNFKDTSFQFHDSILDVFDNVQRSSKDKEVFVTQVPNTIHKYVISINHLNKTVTIADSIGRFYAKHLDEVKARLSKDLGADYKISELPITTQFAPNGCGVFCANMAASLGRTGGDNFSADLLVLTQSGSRMRALDGVRDFMESDSFRQSTNRFEAFDAHVQNFGFENTYKKAHREALAIADDPDFKLYIDGYVRDLIYKGDDLQIVDLSISHMPGRWESIKQDPEVDLKKKVDDWTNSSSPRGKDLARIELEGKLAMFELMRRQVSKASKAEQDMFLWTTYRPLAAKLPDDKKLSDKVFTVQATDGQSLTFPQYISQRGERQNLAVADQYTQFLLWLSLKADRRPSILSKLKLSISTSIGR